MFGIPIRAPAEVDGERSWWRGLAEREFLAILAVFLIVQQAFSWIRWSIHARRLHIFTHENGCSSPPTIPSSVLQGIRHKWNRLRQPGDVFDDYMNRMFSSNGPTHAIAKPLTGQVKAIYTIEPSNIRTILSDKFSDYHRPRTMPNALNPVMGPGVFTSNGEAWAHSRRLVKSQFSIKRVRAVTKLDPHVRNLFEALGPPLESGWTEEQDILLLFNRFTLDAATEFMFGTSTKSHEEAMRSKKSPASKSSWGRIRLVMKDFAAAFDTALDYVALRLKFGRWWFLADSLAFRLACYKMKSYVDGYIRAAISHANKAAAEDGLKTELDDRKYGLISDLVHDYPDKVALRNQVMQLLVAGRDTTAATLTWALILLESHPAVFSELRRSIIATFGPESDPTAPITFENLRRCSYLQWVIFEVVRLYPTGPLNARQASHDTVLPIGGGPDGKSPIAVQAGTTVAFNTYLMHRRHELWGEDAWSFRPERWADRKTGWEYIPFHGGPQTCLGQQHALTEMAYVIVCLLRRFDNLKSSTRATNFENGIRTILVPKHQVLMRFEKLAREGTLNKVVENLENEGM